MAQIEKGNSGGRGKGRPRHDKPRSSSPSAPSQEAVGNGTRKIPLTKDQLTNGDTGKLSGLIEKWATPDKVLEGTPISIRLGGLANESLLALMEYYGLSSKAEMVRFLIAKEMRGLGKVVEEEEERHL